MKIGEYLVQIILKQKNSKQLPQISLSQTSTLQFDGNSFAPNKRPKNLLLVLLLSLRGLSNGFQYGSRMRFVHSLVMAILFRKQSIPNKIKNAALMAKDHGSRLGLYVFMYKFVVGILELIFKRSFHFFSFIAGCVGGYAFCSSWNPINAQIVMYLLSRNLFGITGMMRNAGYFPKSSQFTLLAMLCWGVVMYLYSLDRTVLQNSLSTSMEYLYDESQYYTSWKDFVPFLNNRQEKEWMKDMKQKLKKKYSVDK